MSLQRWIRLAVAGALVWLLVHLVRRDNYSSPTTTKGKTWTGHDRQDICKAQGWKRFRQPAGAPERKVFDLVMVNTELDWLEIRLNSTWEAVDYFVLVEGHKTFTGLEKPLVLKTNMAKFARYSSKIIYHEIEYPSTFSPKTTWDIEDFQRNAMLDQVFPRLEASQAPRPGDVIVVSDVDEIPRPQTLAKLRACHFPRRLTLRSKFYYYSFQFLHRGDEWPHPQATYYQGAYTVRPNDLRMGLSRFPPALWWDRADLPDAGWHCSSCFATMEELLTKLHSFSHMLLDTEEARDRDRIADRVRGGRDLWDRENEEFERVDGNTDVPLMLLAEPERFGYALNRDGRSAGFSDYDG